MDGYVALQVKLDTKSFDKQIEEVEYELKQIDYELSHAKELKLDTRTIQDYEKKAEQLNNKLTDLRKRKKELEEEGSQGFSEWLKNSAKGIEQNIKKIARWALAIFGIRSAYMAVRSAMNILSNYNKQLSTDIDYMKFALAKTLEPLINRIIQLAYRLLSTINSISMAMFKFNLFANASVNDFKKTNASAQQLKKTLSGFDEMNIISDTSGGGAEDITPSFDLSQQNEQLNNYAKNAKTIFEQITEFWEKDWAKAFTNVGGNWKAFFAGIGLTLKGFYDVIKGFVDIIKGIFDIIMGIFKGNTEQIKKGITELCKGAKEIITGLFEIIAGLLFMIVGFVVGVLKDIWDAVYSFIKGLIDTIVSIIKTFISVLAGIFTAVTGIINAPFKVAFDTIKEIISNMFNVIKNIVSGIGKLFTGDLKGALNSFKTAFSNVFGALWAIAKAPLNLIIEGVNSLIKGLNKIKFDVPSWVPGIGGKSYGFNIPKIPKLAVGGVVNMPGRGVMVGGAIAGEAGAEGVIPLTNSQQMELLGEAIGRYITINANITNTMNGRVISRELQKVKNNNDFAFNR